MIDPFAAAGTLRDAYRRVDWAATSLGPVESWSPALLAAVRASEGAVWPEDLPLLMDRRGFPEETYFTLSYSARP